MKKILAGVTAAIAVAGWFGFRDATSIQKEVDQLRPTSALKREFEVETRESARATHELVQDRSKMSRDQMVTKNELEAINIEIGDHKRLLSRSRSTGIAEQGLMIGTDQFDRARIAAAKKLESLSNRRDRLSGLVKSYDKSLATLNQAIDERRGELLVMKTKKLEWVAAEATRAIDKRTVEGEILAADNRLNQITEVLDRRMPLVDVDIENDAEQAKDDAYWLGKANEFGDAFASKN